MQTDLFEAPIKVFLIKRVDGDYDCIVESMVWQNGEKALSKNDLGAIGKNEIIQVLSLVEKINIF